MVDVDVHLELLKQQLPKIVRDDDIEAISRYTELANSKRKVPIPNNETARLVMLRQTQLVDSDQADPDFERYVNLTRRIFKTTFVMISFIDVTRQWVKASAGMATIDATIPREDSIDAYTILPDFPDVFVVPDTQLDERFCDNIFVVNDPKFRFYAGAAISIDALKIGTLSLLDKEPRHNFSIESRTNLFDMASAISKIVKDARINNMRMKRERANLMLGLNHNLRTPLMSLTMVAEMLRNELKNMSRRHPIKKPSFNQNQLSSILSNVDLDSAGNNQDTRAISVPSSRQSTPDIPCMDLIRDLQGSIQQLGLLVEMGLSLGQISAATAAALGSNSPSKVGAGIEGIPCDLNKVYRKVQSLTQRLGRSQNVTWNIDQSRISRGKCVSYPDALMFVLVSSLCQLLPHSDHIHIKACFVPTEIVKEKIGDDVTAKLVESLATAVAPKVVLGEDGVILTELNINGDPSNLESLLSRLADTGDEDKYKTPLTTNNTTTNTIDIDETLEKDVSNEDNHLFALGSVLRNVLGGSSYLVKEHGGVFSFLIPARIDKIPVVDEIVNKAITAETTLDPIVEEVDSELVKLTTKSVVAAAVVLPESVPAIVAVAPKLEEIVSGQKTLKVLLVDDSLTVQKVLGMWLKRNGCHVVEALNGLQALQIMKNQVFDIVCMDFLMPVMDGLTCIKEFNEWCQRGNNREGREQQLMLGLSATALEADEEQAFECGMHMFCHKPVDMKGFASILLSKRNGQTIEQLCETAVRPCSETNSNADNDDAMMMQLSPRAQEQMKAKEIANNNNNNGKSSNKRSMFFGAFRSSRTCKVIPIA